MKPRIHYTLPSITHLEVRYATDTAAKGWGEHCYDYIVRLGDAFKSHLGSGEAIATSSGKGVLHMGVVPLAIDRGHQPIQRDTNRIAYTRHAALP